jgi:predicted HTH transcriptional regulator
MLVIYVVHHNDFEDCNIFFTDEALAKQKIIELAKERGQVTMAEIILTTGSNRNTIKEHLRKLIHDGKLQQHGKGRGVWYTLAID